MRILMLGLDAAGKTSILSLLMKKNDHNCTCCGLLMFYLVSDTAVW